MKLKPFVHGAILAVSSHVQSANANFSSGLRFLEFFNAIDTNTENDQRIAIRSLQTIPLKCSVDNLPKIPSGEKNYVIKFIAMGDIPYSEEEKLCLNQQLRDIDLNSPGGPEFMVHVGDIKWWGTPCTENTYSDVSEIFTHPKNAVNYNPRDCFFVVGDNEWIDCGKGNRDQAWARYWHYFVSNGKYKFGTSSKGYKVERQRGSLHKNMPSFSRAENFAFFERDVVFVGINLIGGNKLRGDEDQRFPQNLQWIQGQLEKHPAAKALVVFAHADLKSIREGFGTPFEEMLRQDFTGLPVLVVHGNGHNFCVYSPDSANANMYAVEVEAGGFAPPMEVSVVKSLVDDTYSFEIDRKGGLYDPPGNCPIANEITWTVRPPIPLPPVGHGAPDVAPSPKNPEPTFSPTKPTVTEALDDTVKPTPAPGIQTGQNDCPEWSPSCKKLPNSGISQVNYDKVIKFLGQLEACNEVECMDGRIGRLNYLQKREESSVAIIVQDIMDEATLFEDEWLATQSVPTPLLTDQPSFSPTPSPTDKPTSTPTPSPTEKAAKATLAPTPSPTETPTQPPTPSPTDKPTHAPTPSPTDNPTPSPTPSPTGKPSSAPTPSPTDKRTLSPTPSPTDKPTPSPTPSPTDKPTISPTSSPTDKPTISPTSSPTDKPTISPTSPPTDKPTLFPTPSPTDKPTPFPTTPSPTDNPTPFPTTPSPTDNPTPFPTPSPTDNPTSFPTPSPTDQPTPSPTDNPTPFPTPSPTDTPTPSPTDKPTTFPTPAPTDKPTRMPTTPAVGDGVEAKTDADYPSWCDSCGELQAAGIDSKIYGTIFEHLEDLGECDDKDCMDDVIKSLKDFVKSKKKSKELDHDQEDIAKDVIDDAEDFESEAEKAAKAKARAQKEAEEAAERAADERAKAEKEAAEAEAKALKEREKERKRAKEADSEESTTDSD